MKKSVIKFISFISCISLLLSFLSLSVSASPAVLVIDKSNKTYTVGENVKVTVKLSAGETIYTVIGELTYNSKVLKYVSGGSNGNTSGIVKIVDEAIADQNTSSASYTIILQAIAEGSSYIGISIYGVNIDYEKISDSQGTTITVKAPATTPPATSSSTPSSSTTPSSSEEQPSTSSNANLKSLSVSAGSLEPAFSAGTTSYKVTVSNDVVSCSVSAKAAESRARVSGTGDAQLNVGDNKVTVTVTAADGTKKNYTVNIYRQTAEETAAANAGGDISPEDPLAVSVGDETLKIVTDISAFYIPEGYTIQTEKRGETDVQLLKENDGDITLYYLTDASGTKTQLYSYDAITGFEQLRYLTVNGRMYILKELEESFVAPEGYYESIVHLSDADIEAYKYEDENLADFYIIYCYADGKLAFYRYDTLEKSIQRAPEFKPEQAESVDADSENTGSFIDKFLAMSTRAKWIIALLAISIICILVLIALLIAKLASKASSAEPTVFDPETDKKPFEKENVYNGFEFDDDALD